MVLTVISLPMITMILVLYFNKYTFVLFIANTYLNWIFKRYSIFVDVLFYIFRVPFWRLISGHNTFHCLCYIKSKYNKHFLCSNKIKTVSNYVSIYLFFFNLFNGLYIIWTVPLCRCFFFLIEALVSH